jgi:hypothetical protein
MRKAAHPFCRLIYFKARRRGTTGTQGAPQVPQGTRSTLVQGKLMHCSIHCCKTISATATSYAPTSSWFRFRCDCVWDHSQANFVFCCHLLDTGAAYSITPEADWTDIMPQNHDTHENAVRTARGLDRHHMQNTLCTMITWCEDQANDVCEEAPNCANS